MFRSINRIRYRLENYLKPVPASYWDEYEFLLWVLVAASAALGLLSLLLNMTIAANMAITVVWIIFLLRWFLSTLKPYQNNISQVHDGPSDDMEFEIHEDDFRGLSNVLYLIPGIVTFLGLTYLAIRGGYYPMFALALSFPFAVPRYYTFGPNDDDMEWKITLSENSLIFRNEKNEAHLYFEKVKNVWVYSAFGDVKKIVFNMEDMQWHKVMYYRGMDRISEYCLSKIDPSKVQIVSYT